MKHVYVVGKGAIWFVAAFVVAILAGGYFAFQYLNPTDIVSSTTPLAEQEYHIITTEYKSKTEDGRVIEVYRWDPGTIVVNQGDRVTLKFLGVHGQMHPFEIKGLGIKGEVKKGRETKVSFIADQQGKFEIVCLTHSDYEHNGPMIGYLVVK